MFSGVVFVGFGIVCFFFVLFCSSLAGHVVP